MGGCPTGTVPFSFPRGCRKSCLQTDLQNEIARKIETLLECQSIAVDEHQQVEKMGEVAPTMYLGMDGTGVPMRTQEVADRAGKQADGSAKTREAKLVTIWTAESRDKEGKPVRDPGSVTYSAAIESAATLDTSPHLSDFAERVRREAACRGFTEAPHQVVLGDGSTWIWNTATELFPPATQILDRFHAKEHLGEVGKVIYGDRPEGQAWIDARCEELAGVYCGFVRQIPKSSF